MKILNKIEVYCSIGGKQVAMNKIKCDLELTELSFSDNIFIGYLARKDSNKRLNENDMQDDLWKWLIADTLYIELYQSRQTYFAIEFMVESETKDVIIKFTK